jgi:cadmium resistance protein CadD (predicted permease)
MLGETLVTAAASFIGTETDDFLISVILYTRYPLKRQRRIIAAGQLTGLFILAGGSAFFSLLLTRIPTRYIGLLGCIPIALGIKNLVARHAGNETTRPETASADMIRSLFMLSTILVIGDGGDNIGVYVPLFATMPRYEKIITLICYALLDLIWIRLQVMTASIPALQKRIDRIAPWIVPPLYIILGISILAKNNTLEQLIQLVK